jgi:hypothetical protein
MSSPSPEAEPRRRRRRRGVLFALLIGLAAFGLVGAAAATLGGIGGQKLGADDTVVASCDTDGVTLAYTTTYDSTSGTYKVTAVTVSGINTACNTENMSVTLKDSTGASLGTGTAVVNVSASPFAQSVTIAPTAAAKSVVGASVVISG